MNSNADIGWIREALKKESRLAFSKQYRLEVAAVVGALDPPIWSRRLSQTLGIAENQVASELVDFAKMGALQRFPATHDRRKLYQVVPHPFWPYARGLFELTIRLARPEDGDEQLTRYWEAVLDLAEPEPIPRGES